MEDQNNIGRPIRMYTEACIHNYYRDIVVPYWMYGHVISSTENKLNVCFTKKVNPFCSKLRSTEATHAVESDYRHYELDKRCEYKKVEPLEPYISECAEDNISIKNECYEVSASDVQICKYLKGDKINYQKIYLECLSQFPIFKMKRETMKTIIEKKDKNGFSYTFGFTYDDTYIIAKMGMNLNIDDVYPTTFLNPRYEHYHMPNKKEVIYVQTKEEKTIFIREDNYYGLKDFVCFVKTRGKAKRFQGKSQEEIIKMMGDFRELIRGYFDPNYSSKVVDTFKLNFIF